MDGHAVIKGIIRIAVVYGGLKYLKYRLDGGKSFKERIENVKNDLLAEKRKMALVVLSTGEYSIK